MRNGSLAIEHHCVLFFIRYPAEVFYTRRGNATTPYVRLCRDDVYVKKFYQINFFTFLFHFHLDNNNLVLLFFSKKLILYS